MTRFIVAILLVVMAVGVQGRRRSSLRKNGTVTERTDAPSPILRIAPDSGKFLLSGYDKTLRARKETLFVTNNDTIDAAAITLNVTYRDMQQRQLHSRIVEINCDIPAGETRKVDFRSWDTQFSFYYHKSKRPRTSAIPYDVSIRIDSVAILINE